MAKAGIEPGYSPHDLRGAVASKLLNLQAGEDRVMELGRWKSRRTLMQHYFKRTFYLEADESNRKIPLWKLLRTRITKVEEYPLQQIHEKLPTEEEET
jgi:integrase